MSVSFVEISVVFVATSPDRLDISVSFVEMFVVFVDTNPDRLDISVSLVEMLTVFVSMSTVRLQKLLKQDRELLLAQEDWLSVLVS